MRYGSKGDGATIPLGSKVPPASRPPAPPEAPLISVGRCVKVTETMEGLPGPELLHTVLGGVAVAQLLPQPTAPALRIVPAEVSLPGLPAQAQRLSRIENILTPAAQRETPADPAAQRATSRGEAALPSVPVYRPSLAPAPTNRISQVERQMTLLGSAKVVAHQATGIEAQATVHPSAPLPSRPITAAPSRPLTAAPSRPLTAAPSRPLTAAPASDAARRASSERLPSPVTPASASEGARVGHLESLTPGGGRPLPARTPPSQAAAAPAMEGRPAPAQRERSAAELPAQVRRPEPTALPPAPAAAAPGREIFRRAAVEAHALGPRVTDTDDPKRGAWSMLILLLSLVAAIFCGAALLSVEVTVRAPGALRAPNGLRSVESVLSGAVTEVLVRAGDEVAAHQIVARLEETQLRASLTLRERELETLRRDTEAAAAADEALFAQTTQAVLHQRAALGRRSSIHQTQMRQRAAQLSNVRELRRHGVATGNDELSGEELVQSAAESIALVGSQLAELNLALADRQRDWKQRELDRRAALARASAAVDEAKSLLAMAEIRSPAAGRVESLLVHPGAVVQPGEVLAQIVPADAPRMIVAFLPSREMSFVSVGSEANVEVESLPVNEFGMARAKVSRISSDIAKAEEIEKAFGEVLPGSYVRVELTLVEDGGQQKMAPHLRSGERVLVRLHRRQQRVLSMIFEFARKWLDS